MTYQALNHYVLMIQDNFRKRQVVIESESS